MVYMFTYTDKHHQLHRITFQGDTADKQAAVFFVILAAAKYPFRIVTITRRHHNYDKVSKG